MSSQCHLLLYGDGYFCLKRIRLQKVDEFFCDIAHREKQCGHSSVLFINSETEILQLPRCRIGHSFLGGRRPWGTLL